MPTWVRSRPLSRAKVVAGVNRIVVAAGAPEVATYVKIFFAPEKGVLTTEEKITKYHLDES